MGETEDREDTRAQDTVSSTSVPCALSTPILPNIQCLLHCLKWGEGRSIGVAFYLILNSQNKNPHRDTQVFIKTETESDLDIATLIMICESCFWTVISFSGGKKKQYICIFT